MLVTAQALLLSKPHRRTNSCYYSITSSVKVALEVRPSSCSSSRTFTLKSTLEICLLLEHVPGAPANEAQRSRTKHLSSNLSATHSQAPHVSSHLHQEREGEGGRGKRERGGERGRRYGRHALAWYHSSSGRLPLFCLVLSAAAISLPLVLLSPFFPAAAVLLNTRGGTLAGGVGNV